MKPRILAPAFFTRPIGDRLVLPASPNPFLSRIGKIQVQGRITIRPYPSTFFPNCIKNIFFTSHIPAEIVFAQSLVIFFLTACLKNLDLVKVEGIARAHRDNPQFLHTLSRKLVIVPLALKLALFISRHFSPRAAVPGNFDAVIEIPEFIGKKPDTGKIDRAGRREGVNGKIP